ncbi:LysR family transcriptional regulator [Octadecabacter ascidiaceicola]|uniref:HTH-type transcriptional regulator DmlR n=1 Tax=Octadecabacter ascidiaceicola TaxID=1655543 RepID=A0A238K1F1_9RHOB|nr:LysR family transcriptional regulator [Octadecabacter ascidiaceicola]SMX36738.1 HTH-type transcriptional regulator DmlR [Octadecabacter ascidiaceicola]
MIDRLRQMAIFAKTIDHGSFRGAARELNLSPSVVSHHVSQLEEHLGVALIYRSTRKLTLTNEGQRLLTATRNMLDAVEGELQDLSATAGEPSGELRITLPSVLSSSRITDHIAAFSLAFPRITLTVDFSDTRRALIDDRFDLAIRMGPQSKNSATTRTLFEVRRVLVASKDYLAKRTIGRDPSTLTDWEWLVLAPVQNTPLSFRHKGGETIKIKPTPHMFTNDAQALHRLAKAGAGLAIVPEFLVKPDIESSVMDYVLPNWELRRISVYAEWPANVPKNGLVHLALSALQQAKH